MIQLQKDSTFKLFNVCDMCDHLFQIYYSYTPLRGIVSFDTGCTLSTVINLQESNNSMLPSKQTTSTTFHEG